MAAHHRTKVPLSEQSRNIKPRRLLAGIVTGKTATQAAIDAGYAPSTARQSREILLTLQSQYGLALAEIITPRRLMELIADGTQAMRVDAFLHQATGQVVYSKELPDYRARREYLELASRIIGLLVRNVQVTGTGPGGEIELSVQIEEARKRVAMVVDAEVTPQDVVVEPSHNPREPASHLEST